MNLNFIKDYYPNLLSWKELSQIINVRPILTSARVHVIDVDETKLTWEKTHWEVDDCIPPQLLIDFLQDHVVYLSEMSRCSKKINDLCAVIEKEYESPTDAHIYICRDSKIIHPFGIHYDYSHNVIVQCEGKTNFKVWDEIEDKNIKRCNMPITESPILEIDMEPGDAIFIPAYYPHLATSCSSRMSVSFPFPFHNDYVIPNRDWVEI